MHYVAFLDDVFLAFKSQATCFLRALLTLARYEVVVGDNFRTDKSFFKVRVNFCGSSWRSCANFGCPCPDFSRQP